MWPDMGMVKMIKPDLQLVLTLISAYLFGFRDGVVVGICCGILRDCISARYLGTGLLLLFLCGVFASFFMRKRFTNNLVTIFLLTFVITLIVETVIFIIQIAILRRQIWLLGPYLLSTFLRLESCPRFLLILLRQFLFIYC